MKSSIVLRRTSEQDDVRTQKHVKYDNFNLYWNITASRWLHEAYRVVNAAASGVRRWRQWSHIQWNLSDHFNNTKSKSYNNNLSNGTPECPHTVVNNNGIDANSNNK